MSHHMTIFRKNFQAVQFKVKTPAPSKKKETPIREAYRFLATVGGEEEQ